MKNRKSKVLLFQSIVLAIISSGVAQSPGGADLSEPAQLLVGVVDAITFTPIETLPELFLLASVFGIFYFLQLNILNQALSVVDESIKEATERDLLWRFDDDDGKPVGTRGVSLALAFFFVNGALYFLGLTGALTLGLLGLAAVFAGYLGIFSGGDEGEDGGDNGGMTEDQVRDIVQNETDDEDQNGGTDWGELAEGLGNAGESFAQAINTIRGVEDEENGNGDVDPGDIINAIRALSDGTSHLHRRLSIEDSDINEFSNYVQEIRNNNIADAKKVDERSLEVVREVRNGNWNDSNVKMARLEDMLKSFRSRDISKERQGYSRLGNKLEDVVEIFEFLKKLNSTTSDLLNDEELLEDLSRYSNRGFSASSDVPDLRASINELDVQFVGMMSDLDDAIQLLNDEFKMEQNVLNDVWNNVQHAKTEYENNGPGTGDWDNADDVLRIINDLQNALNNQGERITEFHEKLIEMRDFFN